MKTIWRRRVSRRKCPGSISSFAGCRSIKWPSLREKFDVVIFMGVLYHLRHPLLALDLLHQHVTRDLLLFQSLLRGQAQAPAIEEDYPFAEEEVFEQPGYPRMVFVEKNYSHDPTNWWLPNAACAAAMLRSSGIRDLRSPRAGSFRVPASRRRRPPR